MFYDLNIPYDREDTSNLAETLVTAIRYGYGSVALNLTVSSLTKDDVRLLEAVLTSARATWRTLRSSRTYVSVIETIDLEGQFAALNSGSEASNTSKTFSKLDMALVKEAMARLDASGKRFLQFKRVTIDMSQDSQIQSISANNPLLSAFDIVAVQPMTEKLFLAAVQSTEIDLISFDATKRMNYRIKTAVARQAVDSGIMFEICFKDALRDPQTRKTAFSNARRIIEATKGKNVVISSGAKEAILLRGPYDLINLSHIFGLEASIARKALSQNPRAVLLHAQTRRSYRGVVDLHQIADLEEHMKWTVPALKKPSQNSMLGLMDAEVELSGDDEDSEEDEAGTTSSFHMDVDTHQASSSRPVLASSKGSLPDKKAKGKRKRDE